MISQFDKRNFPNQAMIAIASKFGTPTFVYSEKVLLEHAEAVLSFPRPYGFVARYAMKACPSLAILKILAAQGLAIDASSGYEVLRAERAGVSPDLITLTAQELPPFFGELIERGVHFNACSLHQLETYGKLFPGRSVGVRFNPGLGSGHANRVNTGGPASSFGVWHEYQAEVQSLLERYELSMTRIHSHIGAGTDPEIWIRCAQLTLAIAAAFPTVVTVSLGGGFKVARMESEKGGDLAVIGEAISKEVEKFATAHGRELSLEIEPGTYLVANAGALVSRAIDIVDTGPQGYQFIKIDGGMTEVLRPSLYGAQHPLWSVTTGQRSASGIKSYLVVGHCCESGDILTPQPGNPEGLLPREMETISIGDLVLIGAVGAYCSSMSARGYNSFPQAPEVLLGQDGSMRLIRRREEFDELLELECP